MLRKALFIGVIHLLVALGCFAVSIGSATQGLDTGAAPSAVARITTAVGDFLLLPVARPVFEVGGKAPWAAYLGYPVLVMNSLIWGLLLAWLGGLLWRRPQSGDVRLRPM
jgi:hypothetical protein